MSMADLTRPDFPILERVVNGRPLVFLDSAASSQKPASVLEAMTRYYERSHANVHRSIHTLGEEATELYEGARDAVRGFIGAASREEIIFTRGTTEGVNLVAQAIGRTLVPGDEIIVTEMEHHSNLIPWQMALPRPRRAPSSRCRCSTALTSTWRASTGCSRRARASWPSRMCPTCSAPSTPWSR